MKKLAVISALIGMSTLIGCASGENQVRSALEKNPDLVFEVIEKNPEKFIEVVNKAAQAAQRGQYEKQMAKMKQDQEEDIKNPKQPALDDSRLLFGSKEAPITIVEYADFQCPFCSTAYRSLKTFADKNPGKVRFYYKHMPLNIHEMAEPAAIYYEAIRLQDKEKAHRFYTSLFENQRELKSEDFLKATAKKVGANMAELSKNIQSSEIRKRIQEDMSEFEKFGFNGTPSIIINGVALSGAQPLEEIERVAALTQKK